MEPQFFKQAISAFAMLTGLYDETKAKGAAKREAELEDQRPDHGAFTIPVTMRAVRARWAPRPGRAGPGACTRRGAPVAGQARPAGGAGQD